MLLYSLGSKLLIDIHIAIVQTFLFWRSFEVIRGLERSLKVIKIQFEKEIRSLIGRPAKKLEDLKQKLRQPPLRQIGHLQHPL